MSGSATRSGAGPQRAWRGADSLSTRCAVLFTCRPRGARCQRCAWLGISETALVQPVFGTSGTGTGDGRPGPFPFSVPGFFISSVCARAAACTLCAVSLPGKYTRLAVRTTRVQLVQEPVHTENRVRFLAIRIRVHRRFLVPGEYRMLVSAPYWFGAQNPKSTRQPQ